MKNRMNVIVNGVFLVGVVSFLGCVNPPQRASGVNPNPVKSPPAGGQQELPNDSLQEDPPGRVVPTVKPPGNGEVRTPEPTAPGGSGAVGTQVSYWLNQTSSTNCLSIQIAGVDSQVSSACPATAFGTWVDTEIPSSSQPFKATIKVDTTEKNQNRFNTSSDQLAADTAWRWRCLSKTDPVSKKSVHVVCYEDGDANTLSSKFESSDLFIRISGPASVDLGAIKCTQVNDFDMTTCSGK